MLLVFHTNFEHVFVAYISTHLPIYLWLTYKLIFFFPHIRLLATEEKNTIVTVTANILRRKIKPLN